LYIGESLLKKKTCISIFSGGGGLDLGLEAVGFETLAASDIDEHSCNSLRANKETSKVLQKPFLRSSYIFQEDIAKTTGQQILDEIGYKRGEISLLAGGPPCQAFSVFGKRRGRNDPRGLLANHYLRLIKEIDPEAFVFENVYGLLTIEGGAVFEELLDRLSNPSKTQKYTLSVHRVNAVDYGVPQFRDRVFIIGAKEGAKVSKVPIICAEQADLITNLPRWRTVRDAFQNLPRIGEPSLANHIGRNHSQRIIDRYGSMGPGERDKRTRINKLNLDRPSFTIIVGSDAGGGKGHIHPTEPREVTPRESARIQSFPDWWWFSGTSRHPIRQVGNAVPSLLGGAIGTSILKQIFGYNARSFEEMVDLLDQGFLFGDELTIPTPLKAASHHEIQEPHPQPTPI
jgi:DNA (cytosine-5)-methyltransferase 1